MAYQPKSYRRFLVTSVTAAAVIATVAPNALAAVSTTADATSVNFTDVTENTRHSEAILDLAGQGIIQGFPGDEFRPSTEITRGAAAIMIARSLGLMTGEDVPTVAFTDVKEGTETFEAVAKLSAAGIVGGFSETSYAPDENLTRGQMAKLLVEAFDLEVTGDGSGTVFTDVSANVSTGAYIETIAELGITSGKSATSFGTQDNIIRGDFAALLFNTMNLVEEDEDEVTVWTLADLGEDAYRIDDNTNFGSWGVNIYLDQLPEEFAEATGYVLVIDGNEIEFTANPFNSNVFSAVVSDSYTVEEVEAAVVLPVLPEEDGDTDEDTVVEFDTLLALGEDAYRIDDNTNFGSWGVNIYLDQLSAGYEGKTSFTLVIDGEEFAFNVNPFNANILSASVSDSFSKAEVEAGLVVAE